MKRKTKKYGIFLVRGDYEVCRHDSIHFNDIELAKAKYQEWIEDGGYDCVSIYGCEWQGGVLRAVKVLFEYIPTWE